MNFEAITLETVQNWMTKHDLTPTDVADGDAEVNTALVEMGFKRSASGRRRFRMRLGQAYREVMRSYED